MDLQSPNRMITGVDTQEIPVNTLYLALMKLSTRLEEEVGENQRLYSRLAYDMNEDYYTWMMYLLLQIHLQDIILYLVNIS